jgi:hypothetical protein
VDDLQVRVNGASDAYRLSEIDGRRAVEAPVDAGGDVTVSWQPATMGGAGEALVQCDTSIGVTIDDAGLHAKHRFKLQTRQGSVREMEFTLPTNVSVRRISGEDVAGWEQPAAEGDTRRLKLFLRRDITDATTVEVDLFAALPPIAPGESTQFSVPQLVPQKVTRENGDVSLFAAPELSLTIGETQSLRQVNLAAEGMDGSLAQPGATPRFAFRFVARPFTLTGAAVRRATETRVVSQHGAEILLRKTLLASRFQFDLREAPRASLSFILPAGYLTLDVQADYLSDWYITEDVGEEILTVEFDQPRTGQVQVLLEGSVPHEPDAASVEIIVPEPFDADRSESQLGVWINPAYTASIGGTDDWRPLDPAQLSDTIRSLRTRPPQFAFRASQPFAGVVEATLTRAAAELSGDLVLLTAVSDAAIDYGLTFRWRIDRAATDTFVVAVPEWLGNQLEFQGEGIRQTESAPLPDGRIAWTITLHQPVQEEYLLSAAATLPLPEDDVVRTPDVRFLQPGQPQGGTQELAVQRRYLVLVNLSGVHQLSPVDPDAIVPAQREQLPLTLQDELLNQALEIASLPVGGNLPEWNLALTAAGQAAGATVLLADLHTVLEQDGTWRTQADYRVRNRGRQFLAVQPPAQSRLLSAMVRGHASQAIRHNLDGKPVLLIPLPATSLADLSFDVRLVLAGGLTGGLPRRAAVQSTEVVMPAPQVVSPAQSEEFGLPVLQTLWRVSLPEEVIAEPVEDGTNLTQREEEAVKEAYGKTIFSEIKEQLSLSQKKEGLRRSQSELHLYNLNVTLEGLSKLEVDSDALAAEREDLIEKAQDQIRELEQQQAQEPAAEDTSSLARNAEGRRYILGNTVQILEDNRKAPTPAAPDQDGSANGTLNFSLSGLAAAKETAKAQSAAERKSRVEVREQLDRQKFSAFADQAASPQAQGQPAGGQQAGGAGMGGGGSMFGADWRRGEPADRFSREDMRGWNINFADDFAQLGQAVRIPGADAPAAAPDADAEYTVGGLSLEMTLPRTGRQLTFTKNSGDPRLTLAVRPADSYVIGVGILWGFVWIAVGAWIVWAFRRSEPGVSRARSIFGGMAAVGLLGAALLAGEARFVALGVFLAGAAGLISLLAMRPRSGA